MITESVYLITRDVTVLQIVEMGVMSSAPTWVSIGSRDCKDLSIVFGFVAGNKGMMVKKVTDI